MPYVKTSVRTTRSGAVRYLQLAHNERDPEAGRPRTRVLCNFGREDELDKDAVRRLVAALSRLLDPAGALAAAEPGKLAVTGSRPAGGVHALDQLWRRLGLEDAVRATLAGRRLSPETGRVLFALAANRALAASSKLAAADWISGDVHVDGLPETSDDACYRAMDHLPEIEPGLAGQASYQLTGLLNLEVDLLFFDTASTYFETEQEDADVPRDERGFTSRKNRRALMQGGGGYITGEKLRTGSQEVKAVLSRQGRYKTVRDNLQVKEVRLGDDSDRFIICYNPDQAERDAAIRVRLVAQLGELTGGTDALTAAERARTEGTLAGKPALKRFLRVTPAGLLRTGKARIKAEENLDGKYLLRSSDPHLSAEDIALGYKQLLEVERGWRDMKQVIDLRPVYHRREDRIRAHVILCWLALLLIRVTENATGQTWNRVRAELQRQHAVTWTGPAGTFRQTTGLTKPLRDIYTALAIEPPKKILALDPAPPAS